ncbi:MAG TPA: hypothetical protein VL563_11520 [Gemmatimonadales bacterium]|jgi:hypothetical protein|nr:hypothetical protein [Gemmatimonadales bacterium]
MNVRRWLSIVASLSFGIPACVSAQATGTTTFNAPYRAFTNTEFGILISFPNGGGTAFEGVYRMASDRFDIGFKGGLLDPSGPGSTVLLLGAEARERVLTHSEDFPLDGALIFGIGGNFVSGNSELIVPVGLSLGRRLDTESSVSIVPYAQPTMFLTVDGGSDVLFALGLGADFRLSRSFDLRVSAGLGDVEGVSLGAVWVH